MSSINKINLNIFKVLEISEKNIDLTIYTCDLCNKHSTTLTIFDPCNHNCCLLCVDNLYDSYVRVKINNTMFICPFCDCEVLDIVYKK